MCTVAVSGRLHCKTKVLMYGIVEIFAGLSLITIKYRAILESHLAIVILQNET